MLKRLLAITVIATFGCTTASALQLSNYEQITNALASGHSVLLNINPEKCKPAGDNTSRIKRLAFKFKDLFEFETAEKDGKLKRAIAIQETGLFGNTKFVWYRTLTLIMEDNSVLVLDDQVDPSSYNLKARAFLTCQLTTDNSGGAIATQLSS